jgi:uncharacterized membrane protein (DUF485 family)
MANNMIQQHEQKNMSIVTSINQIDAQISELYRNLEALSVQSNPDISKQTKILGQISELQQLKSNLYNNLNDSYSNIQLAVAESRNALVNETAMSNVIKHELSNVTTSLNTLKNNRADNLRLAEINNYYSSKYSTQTTVMKTIVYFCIPILILMRKEILPQNIALSIISIVIGIALVIIILQVIDIRQRSNMVFDEYNWNFDPNSVSVNRISNDADQPPTPSMESSLTCIGQECCPPGNTLGTVWNSTQQQCTANPTQPASNTNTSVDATTTEGFVGERCLKKVFDKFDFNVNIFKNNNVVHDFDENGLNYAKF